MGCVQHIECGGIDLRLHFGRGVHQRQVLRVHRGPWRRAGLRVTLGERPPLPAARTLGLESPHSDTSPLWLGASSLLLSCPPHCPWCLLHARPVGPTLGVSPTRWCGSPWPVALDL